MTVSHQLATEMLEKIEDPETRQRYAAILQTRVTKKVRCDSCGKVVAFIDENKQYPYNVIDTGSEAAPGTFPKQGLAAHRQRLDGTLGFQCWCGNDERLLPEEEGLIGSSAPSPEALEKIAQRINARMGGHGSKFTFEDAR